MDAQPTLTDDLYHYTAAGVALDAIVALMQLRLGLVEATNDPRESRPRYPPIQGAASLANDEPSEIWDEADRLVRRQARVACFTLDYELPDTAIASSSLRGYAHPALWAHYAAGHAGVALRFSRTALERRIGEALDGQGAVFHGAVDYVLDSFAPGAEPLDMAQVDEFGLDAVVARYAERHHRLLFFRKHMDWAYENEYRWVHLTGDARPTYIDVGGCLTGIVLGDAFPDARVDAVLRLADHLGGLEVRQVRFHNGSLILVPLSPAPQRAARPHGRSGSLAERTSALALAEREAASAHARAELFAQPLVAQLDAGLTRVAEVAGGRIGVDVALHRSLDAIAPSERGRAAGVNPGGAQYERGTACVVENRPGATCTFVAAAALQVRCDAWVAIHARISVEQWRPTGNVTEELWGARREASLDPDAAGQALGEVLEALLGHCAGALDTFDERRAVSG